jgi:hypothetical protein
VLIFFRGFPKSFKDQEFHRDFLKLVGEDAEPLMPEELAQVIRGNKTRELSFSNVVRNP